MTCFLICFSYKIITLSPPCASCFILSNHLCGSSRTSHASCEQQLVCRFEIRAASSALPRREAFADFFKDITVGFVGWIRAFLIIEVETQSASATSPSRRRIFAAHHPAIRSSIGTHARLAPGRRIFRTIRELARYSPWRDRYRPMLL